MLSNMYRLCLLIFLLCPLFLKAQYTIDIETDSAYARVDQAATYPGGSAAMIRYLEENVRLQLSELKRLEGRNKFIALSMIINEDGSISDVQEEESTFHISEYRMENAVKSMPNWAPAQKDGAAVKSKVIMPIHYTVDGGQFRVINRGVYLTKNDRATFWPKLILLAGSVGLFAFLYTNVWN